MEFIIAIVIGIAWGWWAREHAARKHVEKMFSEHLEQPETDNESVLFVKVEKHGDSYYLFTEDTEEFVAQGKTLDEIREIVGKRYHGKKSIAIRKGNDMGLLP